MEDFGYACAVALAGVLVWAGAAKLARPTQTAASFAALGVPAPAATARAVPFAELAVAAALLGAPRAGGIGASVLLVSFTAVLVRAVRAGSEAPCNCFGAARADPVSWSDVARNVMLGGLAVLAILASRPVVPSPVAGLACAVLFAGGYAALTALRAE